MILPRDLSAERETLAVTRALWGAEARVEYRIIGSNVMAEARCPLRSSQPEVSVRGNSNAQATRRLLCLLLAYRSEP